MDKSDFCFTLFIMGEKGLSVLKALIEHGYQDKIKVVVGASDKAVQEDFYSEIKEISNNNGILWVDKRDFREVNSDYALAISWRWMIPEGKARLIVIHDSLLPKYRGFAPLVNMLLNHEPKIGATAIWASDEYDCGDIISQEFVSINYPIKIKDAINKITAVYDSLVLQIFSTLSQGKMLVSHPQCDSDASYSLWRNDDDYKIDWARSAHEIQQYIYSLGSPYLGASALMDDGELVRIFDAEVIPDVNIVNRDNGKVIFMKNGMPIVVCGKGLLKLTDIRDERGLSILPLQRFRTKFS